ncbi:MAG: PAS domain S-box protein [Betaproteobacteria bacterium]|nr:PAS domain S-box protein [Betaproteobacteria bacterium]
MRVVLLYAAFSLLWALLSDRAIGQVAGAPAVATVSLVLKYAGFVAVSALVLTFLLKRLAASFNKCEDDLRNVLDQAGEAICIFDTDLRLVYANPAAQAITGYRAEELHRLSVPDLLSDDGRRMLPGHIERLKNEGTSRDEWVIRTRDGGPLCLDVTSQRLPDGRHLAFGRNLTVERETQREMENERRRLHALMHAIPDPLWLHDADGQCVYSNAAARRSLGLDAQGSPGSGNGEGQEHHAPAALVSDRGVLATHRPHHFDYWHADAGGRRRTLDAVSKAPVFDADGKALGVASVARDVTELHHARKMQERAAARLKALATRQIEIQEEERKTLARELHDEFGQALTAVQHALEMARRHCSGASVEAAVARGIASADQLLESTRNISRRLHPPQLDDLGLVPALRWHVDKLCGTDTPKLALYENVGSERFAPEIELACFRIAQESLCNALRHARAREVSVHLTRRPRELCLSICDDGNGFDVDSTLQSSGELNSLGLIGMRERVAAVDGFFLVDSRPGAGTEILAAFKLAAEP